MEMLKMKNDINGEWVYATADDNGTYIEMQPILRWLGITEKDIIVGGRLNCPVPGTDRKVMMLNTLFMGLKVTGPERNIPRNDITMSWIRHATNQLITMYHNGEI